MKPGESLIRDAAVYGKQELEEILSSIPGGLCIYCWEEGHILPVFRSPAFYEIVGYSQEHIAKTGLELTFLGVHKDDLPLLREKTGILEKEDTALCHTFRMYHDRRGEYRWIHMEGSVKQREDGRRFLFAVYSDISEQIWLERELPDANRQMQDIINAIPSGAAIYKVAESVEVRYLSDGVSRLSGYEEDEYRQMLRRGAAEMVYWEDAGLFESKVKEVMAGHGIADFEYRKRHKDGHIVRVRLQIKWIGEEGGFPLLYCIFYNISGLKEAQLEMTRENAPDMYVRDITEDARSRRDKERMELYFKSMEDNLPGGITVALCEQDGRVVPEFISKEFAAMVNRTVKEVQELFQTEGLAGIYADHVKSKQEKLKNYIRGGEGEYELTGRVRRPGKGDIWLSARLSLNQSPDGATRLYTVYTDITKAMEEQEEIRRQYKQMIIQHYSKSGFNALIGGHCNITQGYIIDVIDHTQSNLLETFGSNRENFFKGLSGFILDEEERRSFLDQFMDEPALKAFAKGEFEKQVECFVQFPKEEKGRYVQITMHMVATPDSEDVTGILTISDITETTIADRILHQLSYMVYDFVVDFNLHQDSYRIISRNQDVCCMPPQKGCYSEWTGHMLRTSIVPKDREQYQINLDSANMLKRLQNKGYYTFAFSLVDEAGDIRTKNMTVSYIDCRLGRVCLTRTDITDSVREQQRLLRVIAYTFELAAFIDLSTRGLAMYTRQSVLDNLPPRYSESYDDEMEEFIKRYGVEEGREYVRMQFRLTTMLERLNEKPGGYDFLLSYKEEGEEEVRYKQINIVWGDAGHRTICMVRADVTDMLAIERQVKKNLENALLLAEEANRAKSDFLSAMSHDIRTPMNAIMGMTMLASANLDDRGRVEDCLHKISISSRHLLSLINDILDMSKLESSKITLGRTRIKMPELLEQLSAMIAPQAEAAGLNLTISSDRVCHKQFYGDLLRINQILINILSNAVKFTPAGGSVEFTVEELPARKESHYCYRFTVRDTGIGMKKDFMGHIFEQFARNHEAVSIEGTGLGLSITKGLIDLMKGRITVESQEGKGSVFRVELECEAAGEEEGMEESPAGRAAARAKERSLAGKRFLVAEDNAINAEILCELLKMYGADFVVEADGEQALEAFRSSGPGEFDAILMDIQMPKMNGYEAARAIRAMLRQDAGEIPIIAMTANAFAEDIQAAMDAGMNAHVAKPLDVDVLWETLDAVLR